uniref:Uncharacterized protein n=1 Tax=Vibrio parahaemolyticus TaxID=670 RepID=A0A0C5GRV4_VIBPH|nr:hypothetical protein pVPH1_0030 [Vibrio parahaemolyticus]
MVTRSTVEMTKFVQSLANFWTKIIYGRCSKSPYIHYLMYSDRAKYPTKVEVNDK